MEIHITGINILHMHTYQYLKKTTDSLSNVV